MKMILTLAWRNLWRKKKRSFITISSVLFAIFLAIIFDSLERGSYERMIDNLVKYSTGYIQIQDILYEEEPSIDNSLLFDESVHLLLENHEEDISYYVPRLQNFALAATENITRGVMVIGIEPSHESKLNDLHERMVSGSFLLSDDKDVVLANGLAEILKVQTGDTLVLIGQGFQGVTAAGKYLIKGIVELKVPEMSNNSLFMSLSAAQWFYGAEDRLTSLLVMPHKPSNTHQLAGKLRAGLDAEWYAVLTWKELLKDLLALMKFDMAGSMVMMMVLYIVITFGMFGTIVTMMIERQREYGMLISLGMQRYTLAMVCFVETLFISIAGIIAGVALAIPLVLYFYHNPIPLTGEMAKTMLDYGFEPVMPLSADPALFIKQIRIVLILAILVGMYPIYKIFSLDIQEVRK
ncbi:MAG: ABC transporter permease [Cyclobacteriaceae bacterium]|nr:ABC transporter permease [Cyclobacteriaceae bacterium]